jgi:hypothetical protein
VTVKTFVDVEAAAKAWARADSDIAALVSTRVFLGVNNQAPFPQLIVQRVGGTAQDGNAPLDDATVSFSCWAASRAAAGALAYVVMSAAESMTGPTPMGSAAVGHGARTVLAPLYVTSDEDEKAGRYRYVVDVAFTIRAA